MDELLARQTPHSVEAEQAVIGAILFDPTCVPKVVELLQPVLPLRCARRHTPAPAHIP